MKVINHTLPRDFNLFLIGDSHEGTILRSDKGWEQFVDMLNSDYGDLKASRNRWCDHGDMIEAIATDDKRYFDLTHKKGSTLTRQIDTAIKQREKIKKKCLFILQGNHERKLHRYGDFVGDPEVENSICKALNVPYGTYECINVYKDAQGFLMFRHFASHGFRSIRSAAKDADQRLGNRLASLKILLQWKVANCLLQSMGHCFSDDTEILTGDGWVKHEDLCEGLNVLTFNTKTEAAEWQPVNAIYRHVGKYETMLEFKTQNINFCVTDKHRLIYRFNKNEKWKETIANNAMKLSQFTIPVAGNRDVKPFDIDDNMISLIGWLVAEGHFRKNGAVQLFQNWSRRFVISDLLDSLGIQYSIYRRNFEGRKFKDPKTGKEYITKEDSATFYISIKESVKIRKYITKKEIPSIVSEFSNNQFNILLNAMVLGDGTYNPGGNAGVYYTSCKKIADTFQVFCIMHGWRSNLRQRRGCYEITFSRGTGIGRTLVFNNSKVKIKEPCKVVKATDTVWCVSVDNGSVFTRRNGQVAVLGNTHQLLVNKPKQQLAIMENNSGIEREYTSPKKVDGFIHPDFRWYVNSGSFLKIFADGVSSYASVAGYDPSDLGFAIVKVRKGLIDDIDEIKLT